MKSEQNKRIIKGNRLPNFKLLLLYKEKAPTLHRHKRTHGQEDLIRIRKFGCQPVHRARKRQAGDQS